MLLILFYFLAIQTLTNAVGIPVQVVRGTIVEINGSMTDMGCRGPVSVNNGTTTCGTGSDGFISYLIDGISPDINTNYSNWASQLVTVRSSEGNAIITTPHVLLTFGFETPVSVTGIEIDLFNCPDWNIGATNIVVYLDTQLDLSQDLSGASSFVDANAPLQSCDSSTRVTINELPSGPYQTFHVLILLDSPPIELVYVGEVRFLDNNGNTITYLQGTIKPPTIANSYSKDQPNTTSVIGNMGKDCSTCSKETWIVVSAVSLLLIVILSTVILVQCLLIIRMRRSSKKTETYTETTNPTTSEVPVSPNEAYARTRTNNYLEATNSTISPDTDVPVSANEAYELTNQARRRN